MDYIKIAKQRGIDYALTKLEIEILKKTACETYTDQARLLRCSKQKLHWTLAKYGLIRKSWKKDEMFKRAMK